MTKTTIKQANKITSPVGTLTAVPWPEVASWILCGWALETPMPRYALVRKVR
jgi:hypothetical protein